MTREEKHLWYDFLERFPVPVKRQYVFGPYIVDFVCFSARIVIEVDGRQHLTPEMKKADAERDAYLAAQGFRVLRYPNSAINKEFGFVTKDILRIAGYTFDDLKPIKQWKRRVPENIE